MALPIIISVAIVIIAVAIIVEVRSWFRGTRIITRHQKTYRLTAAFVLEIILLMILLGKTITTGRGVVVGLSYWTAAMALAFLLIALALLDVKATLSAYTETRRDMYRGLMGEDKSKE